MFKRFCEHEERKAAKKKEAELQVSIPMEIENVKIVGCGETIVVAYEFIAVKGNEEVVDISKSITTLSSNEWDVNGVEPSEVYVSFNEEDEVNMELSNINNVCLIFDNVQELPSNDNKLFMVDKKENDSILYFTNPNEACFVFDDFQGYAESIHEEPYIIFSPNQRLIYDDECVPQTIIPDLNKTKIRGWIFFEEGEDDMSKGGTTIQVNNNVLGYIWSED